LHTDIYSDFSSFYDFYVGGKLDDLSFYLEYAQKTGGPLLEIGAGSGRLTIPLARAGFALVAVDISASMLDLLRAKLARETEDVRERVEVLVADLCRLGLGRRFGLIFLPFYTFNYMLTAASQAAALKALRAHLPPGGRLLLEVFLPLRRLADCPAGPVLRKEAVDPATGLLVRSSIAYRYDRGKCLEYRTHIFEIARPGGGWERREFETTRRYFFPDELAALFDAHGLAAEGVYGGYKKEPLRDDAEQIMYVLKNATAN